MISFSIESSPDTVYLEDLISFQADLKDLDEFPEELSEISSACSNKYPEQEQEHFDCSPSPSSSVSSQPTSPFSHIKNSYTIPKSSISPERFNTFHHRRSLCTKHHSVYVQSAVCLDPILKCSINHLVWKHYPLQAKPRPTVHPHFHWPCRPMAGRRQFSLLHF